MTYIGYIVNRDTASVEIYAAETFEDLKKQIDERYTELREEIGYDEPEEDEDDPLGEDYDWDYTELPDLVPKSAFDKALNVAEELGSTILTEYVYGVDRGDFDDPSSGANDPDEWAITKKNVIAKLSSIGIDGEEIYRDIYEEVIMGEDD